MLSGPLWDGLLLAGGAIALYIGAETLVAGAGRLALGLGLRAITVGVTVIAFATTAPELFVATIGALDVSADIGLGAVLGSNIANIGLVLGLSALIRPLTIPETVFYRDVPFMLFAAVLLVVLGFDGRIGRLEGAIFLLVLAGYTAYILYYRSIDTHPDVSHPGVSGIEIRDVAYVIGGLIVLVIGSRWLVAGGTGILSELGFSDLFIGLTVLALGTSLPELAASVVGARRDEADFAVGNVIGSNIYNIVGVLGIVAIIVPINIQRSTLLFELPTLVVFTVVLVALMGAGRKLSRADGLALVGGYGVFLYLLFP